MMISQPCFFRDRPHAFVSVVWAFGFFCVAFSPTSYAGPAPACPDARPPLQRWPSPRYTQTLLAGLETRIFDLSKQRKAVGDMPSRALFIAVHTTSRGSHRYNRMRSHRRAQAIRAQLIAYGLPAHRIAAQGFGEDCPLLTQASHHPHNSRIDIYLSRHLPPRWTPSPSRMPDNPPVSTSPRYVLKPSYTRLSTYRLSYRAHQIQPSPHTQALLQKLIQQLQSNPLLRLSIETHSDHTEQRENPTITKQRALSLYKILRRMGGRAHQLGYQFFGADRPIHSNQTAQGRAKNRRVELFLLSRDQ